MTERKVSKRTFSLRLDHDVLKRVEYEAQKKGLSVNATLNHIIRESAEWHLNAPSAEIIYFSKFLISAMADKMTENAINELAKSYADNELSRMAFIVQEDYDIDVAISHLELWLNVSDIPFTHKVQGGTHVFIFNLGLSERATLLIAEICRAIFSKQDAKVETHIKSNMIFLTISSLAGK